MANEYDTENFTSLYKARSNLLEMVEEVGYNTDDYKGFKSSELHSMLKNNQLDMLIENKKGNKIYVKFFEICEKKPKLLNKNIIDNMIEDLYLLEKILNINDTLMIINYSDPNDTIKSHIRHIWEENQYNINIINIKNIKFNLLKHKYVPKHFILDEQEKEEFIKKYNVKSIDLLPEISRFDPVAQIICLKPGNICKIIRPSKNAIEADYFRVCKNK